MRRNSTLLTIFTLNSMIYISHQLNFFITFPTTLQINSPRKTVSTYVTYIQNYQELTASWKFD